jgi:hypothetical protein
MSFAQAECAICHKQDYCRPLHDDKGGPLCCLVCIGKWHGEHGRKRRLGRIVIRAIAAYMNGGGSWSDISQLQVSALMRNGGIFSDFGLDPLGYLAETANTSGENIELTSELLADAIKIAHPDLHPPERRDLAHRVSQGLLALQPFTFPAHKPTTKPISKQPASTGSARKSKLSNDGKSKPYPCKECAATVPYYYCTECKTEWESRNQKERDQENAKQRNWYAKRKLNRERCKPPTICANVTCGMKFRGKREDARFCSDTCRQRAYRGVTDNKKYGPHTMKSRDKQITS